MDQIQNSDSHKFPTSLPDIQNKVLTFHRKMRAIAEFLHKRKAPAELQIKPQDLALEFYIDKDAITRLINIAMQDNFVQFGVFFGIESPDHEGKPKPLPRDARTFGKLTSCILGLDKDRFILGCHFPHKTKGQTTTQQVDGEDTWPPPTGPGGIVSGTPPVNYFSLATDEDTLIRYFDKEGPVQHTT
jgi:hypothetical protein